MDLFPDGVFNMEAIEKDPSALWANANAATVLFSLLPPESCPQYLTEAVFCYRSLWHYQHLQFSGESEALQQAVVLATRFLDYPKEVSESDPFQTWKEEVNQRLRSGYVKPDLFDPMLNCIWDTLVDPHNIAMKALQREVDAFLTKHAIVAVEPDEMWEHLLVDPHFRRGFNNFLAKKDLPSLDPVQHAVIWKWKEHRSNKNKLKEARLVLSFFAAEKNTKRILDHVDIITEFLNTVERLDNNNEGASSSSSTAGNDFLASPREPDDSPRKLFVEETDGKTEEQSKKDEKLEEQSKKGEDSATSDRAPASSSSLSLSDRRRKRENNRKEGREIPNDLFDEVIEVAKEYFSENLAEYASTYLERSNTGMPLPLHFKHALYYKNSFCLLRDFFNSKGFGEDFSFYISLFNFRLHKHFSKRHRDHLAFQLAKRYLGYQEEERYQMPSKGDWPFHKLRTCPNSMVRSTLDALLSGKRVRSAFDQIWHALQKSLLASFATLSHEKTISTVPYEFLSKNPGKKWREELEKHEELSQMKEIGSGSEGGRLRGTPSSVSSAAPMSGETGLLGILKSYFHDFERFLTWNLPLQVRNWVDKELDFLRCLIAYREKCQSAKQILTSTSIDLHEEFFPEIKEWAIEMRDELLMTAVLELASMQFQSDALVYISPELFDNILPHILHTLQIEFREFSKRNSETRDFSEVQSNDSLAEDFKSWLLCLKGPLAELVRFVQLVDDMKRKYGELHRQKTQMGLDIVARYLDVTSPDHIHFIDCDPETLEMLEVVIELDTSGCAFDTYWEQLNPHVTIFFDQFLHLQLRRSILDCRGVAAATVLLDEASTSFNQFLGGVESLPALHLYLKLDDIFRSPPSKKDKSRLRELALMFLLSHDPYSSKKHLQVSLGSFFSPHVETLLKSIFVCKTRRNSFHSLYCFLNFGLQLMHEMATFGTMPTVTKTRSISRKRLNRF